ncbi:MAG: hypothetical protein EHM51_02630 [Geobacter sp.]|nr:MAG: hypothetical protein EHM51_02630 [Geobacter sp.]
MVKTTVWFCTGTEVAAESPTVTRVALKIASELIPTDVLSLARLSLQGKRLPSTVVPLLSVFWEALVPVPNGLFAEDVPLEPLPHPDNDSIMREIVKRATNFRQRINSSCSVLKIALAVDLLANDIMGAN